ncbi:heparan-alpha-glucosaminide N-acetyltransferase [Athalia rosae]|uniref:heparan-alpha-glucosaminide N-acetyltransferase n=1 Tax=Athalia rosae TaxID=37344 RepID=UPI0020340953|nr:heparan-alpha-glucosaminide N-acetyltransferase [Athalia rosae]
MAENWMCDYNDLIYDEACVNIKKNSQLPSAWLYSLSSDCDACPFTRIGPITNSPNQSIKFQTDASLTWRIRSSGDEEYISARNSSDVLCEVEPNLHQFGAYELDIGNETCDVRTLKDPSSLYIPLCVVAAALICVLGGCSLLRIGMTRLRKKLRDEDINGDVQQQQQRHSIKLPAAKRRVKCIDTFRGISILLMIFVNDGAGGFRILQHATWDGLLVADLVFPWFMWIMGVCLPISLGSQLSRNISRFSICKGIVKRSVMLFLIGISLNTLGTIPQLESIRIFGVLQRFSLVYLIVALALVSFSRRKRIEPKNQYFKAISDILALLPQWVWISGIVAAHFLITFHLPVPGCPTGYLGPGGRHEDGKYFECAGGAAGYVDRKLLGVEHIFQRPAVDSVYGSGPFDPEGILGCLSSIFQVFLGVQAGMVLRYYKSCKSRVCRWLIWGGICGCVGLALHFSGSIPINKSLWSMSYVLVTTSLALFLFTVCYVIVDVTKIWRGGPFRIPGMNALAMYVGHELCFQIFPFHWRYGLMGSHTWVLVEALWGTALWTLIAYILHWKRIYVSL